MHLNIDKDLVLKAATKLNIEPCTIVAVATVEAVKGGFLPDGRPVILFEPHWFYKNIRNNTPLISNDLYLQYPNLMTKSYNETLQKKMYRNQGGASAYTNYLDPAIKIHKEQALMSCSWGAFQIMGFNYKLCGFSNVFDFVAAQEDSDSSQVESFITFLANTGYHKYLKNKDFAGFAYKYNGSEYKTNNYDTKMLDAYNDCIKSCSL